MRMRIPEVFYRIEELREGAWVFLAEIAAKQYLRPGQRFNAHERAKAEGFAALQGGDLPRRLLAPDGSVVAETHLGEG